MIERWSSDESRVLIGPWRRFRARQRADLFF
jgi:hypothetical protein